MKILKKILVVLAAIVVVIQFVRPNRNISMGESTQNIGQRFPIPPEVAAILKTACYDCHSNNTRYPWYAEVQPVGWWLTSHVNGAKLEMNFDEFLSYPLRKQFIKLGLIEEQVNEELMPLPSYTIIHRDAILSADQKERLAAWTQSLRDSMRAWYPVDSLVRSRRSPR